MSSAQALTRTFIHLSQAHYGASVIRQMGHLEYDELQICVYRGAGIDDDRELVDEFGIRFDTAGQGRSAKLSAFDDAWPALAQCQDLISALSSHQSTSPHQLAKLLESLGFQDETVRK
ncbi:MAG: hypothetical protein Tsb002_01090 [Wenzhouxiangellaceae bacterium]